MTFNLCVLLYSKYSSSSKKLMEYIKVSQIDFTSAIGLQTLCVDNEEIRKKIISNTLIGITCVPCLLLIYKDGGIEKYEGTNLFNWFEDVVKQLTQSNTKEQEDNYKYDKDLDKEVDVDVDVDDEKQLEEENRKLFEENKKKYEQKHKKDSNSDKEIKRRPIEKSKVKQTRLEELDSEDESDTDRYKNKKPIQDIQEFEEVRKPIVKNSNNANKQKSSDIMNKAKELAKGRESDTPAPPPGYPLNMKI